MLPADRLRVTVGLVKEHPEVHERAIRYAASVSPDLFERSYVLYREEKTGHFHGSVNCATGSQEKVWLSIDDILALPSTGEECECGGWRSTEFFPALLIAHRSWELHRIMEDGGIADIPEALEQIERMQPWWRPDLENLGSSLAAAAALARENLRVELDLIEEFASRLDPSPLLRYVAAHGLRVENDVEGAREFSAWVDSTNPRLRRIPRTRPSVARSLARRDVAEGRFERELAAALAGPTSMVVLERRLWSPTDGATWYTPAEVLLLSFAYGQSPRSSFAWFEATDVVAAGLRTLLAQIPGRSRITGLSGASLPPPEVRSVAESLWTENADTWETLDEVLAAAIALEDDRHS